MPLNAEIVMSANTASVFKKPGMSDTFAIYFVVSEVMKRFSHAQLPMLGKKLAQKTT